MNIGIILHSKTGTTLKFAEHIASKLNENNHSVDLVQLETNIPVDPGSKNFAITNIPDCEKYDALLLGGPVWAFSASPVIIECMEELKDLSGKKVLPFVTMGFPLNGMGGSQSIKLMNRIASDKGAHVLPGKIVPKLFRNQTKLMKEAAMEIQSYFD